jgi:hypothetical protein
MACKTIKIRPRYYRYNIITQSYCKRFHDQSYVTVSNGMILAQNNAPHPLCQNNIRSEWSLHRQNMTQVQEVLIYCPKKTRQGLQRRNRGRHPLTVQKWNIYPVTHEQSTEHPWWNKNWPFQIHKKWSLPRDLSWLHPMHRRLTMNT